MLGNLISRLHGLGKHPVEKGSRSRRPRGGVGSTAESHAFGPANRPVVGRHIYLRVLVLLGCLTYPPHLQAVPKTPAPSYPEVSDGKSALWLQVGPTGWLTDRGPHASFLPLSAGLGFGHQIGVARLVWRLNLAHDLQDGKTSFITADLVSVERVYQTGFIQPFARAGLAVGLDLKSPGSEFGSEGYFNGENGTTAGFGITLGGGLEMVTSSGFLLRLDAGLAAYGGVGRTAVLWTKQLGLGYRY